MRNNEMCIVFLKIYWVFIKFKGDSINGSCDSIVCRNHSIDKEV